jgi:CheY-like chemotaxis protein
MDEASLEQLSVLLVDDNLFNQKVGLLKLEKKGHQVQVASSGLGALAALETRTFDVILMDMQMPEMDGLEASMQIRKNEQGTGRRVPIIAMTAYAGDAVRQKCLQAGMDAYVAKPIQDDQLFKAIRDVLPERGASTAPVASKPNPSREKSSNPTVDLQAVLARVGGSSEVLKELIDVFRLDSAALLAEAADGLKQKDAVTLHRAGHTLKGMISFFEASTATALALKLETLGASRDFATSEIVYPALCNEIARLQAELDSLKMK